MTIYLIRHGETDWNTQMRLQGREDIELNANGIRQAEDCSKAFLHIPVDCILSSPLKRAKQTADIIASRLGLSVIIDDEFIERNFGKLSGLTPDEREKFKQTSRDTEIESWEHLTSRLMGALYRYTEDENYKNIIIVSHGAAINAVLAILSDYEIGTGKIRLKNACINVLNTEGKKIKIEYYNLTAEEFEETL